jgi:rubrerythrin
MIRVPLTVIIFLYLFACLAVFFALWVREERRRIQDTREALRFRLRCAICGFEFEDRGADALPSCPSCGRRNERVRLSPL